MTGRQIAIGDQVGMTPVDATASVQAPKQFLSDGPAWRVGDSGVQKMAWPLEENFSDFEQVVIGWQNCDCVSPAQNGSFFERRARVDVLSSGESRPQLWAPRCMLDGLDDVENVTPSGRVEGAQTERRRQVAALMSGIGHWDWVAPCRDGGGGDRMNLKILTSDFGGGVREENACALSGCRKTAGRKHLSPDTVLLLDVVDPIQCAGLVAGAPMSGVTTVLGAVVRRDHRHVLRCR